MSSRIGETFVGQKAELDELRSAVAAAASRRGSIVLLTGEPGIGRTSLAEAVARHARLGCIRQMGHVLGPVAVAWRTRRDLSTAASI